MANTEVIKTQFRIEYAGDTPDKSGGSYTYSNLRHDATNAGIEQTARAIASLQTKAVRGIFRQAVTQITE